MNTLEINNDISIISINEIIENTKKMLKIDEATWSTYSQEQKRTFAETYIMSLGIRDVILFNKNIIAINNYFKSANTQKYIYQTTQQIANSFSSSIN